MYDIQIAQTDSQIAATFKVMSELRAHLMESDYLPLIRKLQREMGYQLLSLCDQKTISAVAGFRIGDSLAWGHYLYVDDLVSSEGGRSRGHGKALLDWLVAHGRAQQCTQLHLDSGVQRHAAHRFYLRERMDIVFYHFRRDL